MKVAGRVEPASTIRSVTESLKNDENMKELHDAVVQELVQTVGKWIRNIIIGGPGVAAIILYLIGQDDYINPLLASMAAMCGSLFSRDVKVQATVALCVLSVAIVGHSLSQGCTASLVPAIYGFIPGAFGMLYRTTRALIISTAGVLLALLVIFTVDLSGNCPTQSISEDDTIQIIATRLVPMLTLIIGNNCVLTTIVQASEKSLLLHVRASTSAAKLADMRRDVLNRVTHELRTPLNGLVGSVELLAASKALNEIDRENARTARSCLDNILDICDNVLLVAKSDKTNGASRENEEKTFRVASVVDTVAELFTARAASKGIKLIVNYVGNTTAMVRSMEVELRQVLLNLVGNAVKFTDSGSISIRVREEPTSSPNMTRCTFEVEDTGIGVDPESAHLLFEAFHQGEQGNAVSRHHKGTGLGLTICRDTVEHMGGKIHVDGERGRGTRFYFSLDLKKSEPMTRTMVDEESPSMHQSFIQSQIVIADSDKESSFSCRSVVESIAPSASTRIVSSPSELLSIIANEKGDIAPTQVRRIAFIECTSMDTESLLDTLSKIRKTGWIVFAYCEYDEFPLLTKSKVEDAYAIFRQPLPLVRMGDDLRGALAGLPSPRLSPSTSQEEDRTKEHEHASEVTGLSGEPTTVEPLATTPNLEAETNETTATARYKVVIVDDTPLNVRMLEKMIPRLSSMPVVSFYDGQSAVQLVAESSREDILLVLMDWHMPGVCGLTATESIRRIVKENGGPTVYVCMLTANVDGLHVEMESRHICSRGTLSRGESVPEIKNDGTADGALIDLVTEKPTTFKSVKAILMWFEEQIRSEVPGALSER